MPGTERSENPVGESDTSKIRRGGDVIRTDYDGSEEAGACLPVGRFHGSKTTGDAGPTPYRKLDEVSDLTRTAAEMLIRRCVSFRQIAWLLAAGMVLCAAAPTAGESSSAAGLVARWSFDGNTQDRAGGAADLLTPRNTRGAKAAGRFVTAGGIPGVIGRALAIGVRAGDAEYLAAPVSTDVKLGPSYTIEAWIYPVWAPKQLSPWARLVLQWGKPGSYAYHLAIHHGEVSLYHGQADGTYVFAEGGKVAAGRWQHVVGVARRNEKDPARSTLEVYLNGQRTGSGRFDGTIRTLQREGLGIGDSAGAPARASRFRGYLDEVSLWNRALRSEEIHARYARRAEQLRKLQDAPKPVPPAPRVDPPKRHARRPKQSRKIQGAPKPTPPTPRVDPPKEIKTDVEWIVFTERHAGRDGHYYANFGYRCTDPTDWVHGADGGRLCLLNLRTKEVKVLLDDPGGAMRDPCVNYDGRKILFSYRKGPGHYYNLYEIHADGSGLRQITRGDWDDVEPTYLPSGDILFCSTRAKRYVLCWMTPVATLHRCDADGKNIRMLSSNTVTENTPAVLPDGRVLYTRWEYVNRDPVVFHHLWTMNPDGTGQMVYFGNMHPRGVFIDARPIPGTDTIVYTDSPNHGRNEHQGDIAIVTDKYGPDAKSAVRRLTRSKDFRDPYPLSPETFLVAKKNQLLLLDRTGRTKVLYTGKQMVHEPRPLAKRPRERAIPSRVDRSKTTGTVILSDVYIGRNMEGVSRGSIKKLLVLEDLPKPVNYHGGGSQPIGHGVTSTLKRILGTVPVEADGSAHFDVPAMRSVYFALLDASGRSVKQMRSFVTLQPGETASCVGCHEERGQTPRTGGPRLAAMSRPPSRIEPIPDAPEVFDFPRDVQPILDKHCVKCHSHPKRTGGVVLTGDRGPVYSLAYYALRLHWQVKDTSGPPRDGSGRQNGNDPPYTAFSSASPLMKKIDGSHNDVKLSPHEREIVRLWIDAGSQYPGTYAALGTGQVGGCWGKNKPIRVMADGWPSAKSAAKVIQKRCAGCHGKWLPGHVTARVPVDKWGDMLSWTRPLSRFSRHRIFNLTRPDKSLVLLAPLARQAGGYAQGKPKQKPKQKQIKENKAAPPKPIIHPVIFASTRDAGYQALLAHVREARAKLDEIKRFDMPGFRPSVQYVREMKRYGVLPASFDLSADPIDVYEVDRRYWRSFWPTPTDKADGR